MRGLAILPFLKWIGLILSIRYVRAGYASLSTIILSARLGPFLIFFSYSLLSIKQGQIPNGPSPQGCYIKNMDLYIIYPLTQRYIQRSRELITIG